MTHLMLLTLTHFKFNKRLANLFQQCTERITYYEQVRFIPGMQGCVYILKLIKERPHNDSYRRKNHIVKSIDEEKSIWKNLVSMHRKSSQQIEIRWTLSLLNEKHLQKLTGDIILIVKDNTFTLRPGIWQECLLLS